MVCLSRVAQQAKRRAKAADEGTYYVCPPPLHRVATNLALVVARTFPDYFSGIDGCQEMYRRCFTEHTFSPTKKKKKGKKGWT